MHTQQQNPLWICFWQYVLVVKWIYFFDSHISHNLISNQYHCQIEDLGKYVWTEQFKFMHTSDAGIYCVHTEKNIKSGESMWAEQLEYVILVCTMYVPAGAACMHSNRTYFSCSADTCFLQIVFNNGILFYIKDSIVRAEP